MATTESELWVMKCTTATCPARGMEYPTEDASIECGSCGVVYEKPA